MVGSGRRRWRQRIAEIAAGAGAIVGSGVLLATAAAATTPILTRGHAYCFYFSGRAAGGMHLVAAGPRVIAAGPDNYISGTGGKPQDTVVYVNCVDAAGRPDGAEYVGLPRIVLKFVRGHYVFSRHVVVAGVRRLESTDRRRGTVSVSLTGSVATGSSATGAIVGTLRVSAPSCLPKPFILAYTGT